MAACRGARAQRSRFLTLDIAHRGASKDAPENTLAAFELAIEQRADMIETDLHRSADGEIVIYHDAVLAGQSISKLRLSEIRGRSPAIPTLGEMLDAFGSRIPFNLEIKTGSEGDYDGLEAMTIEQVRSRGLVARTLFSSFREPVLERLRALDGEARIGVLRDRGAEPGLVDRARALGAEAIHISRRQATAEAIARYREAGFAVHVYTVDRPAEQRKLVRLGVDGIFTNRPGALRALLDAERAQPAVREDQ